MSTQLSKFLPVLFITVVLAVVGWVVGVQTLSLKKDQPTNLNSTNSSNLTTQIAEDLVYYVRDGDKITIYKATLNSGTSTLVYTFQPKGPFSAFEGLYKGNFLFDENIANGDDKIKSPKFQRILISQNGEIVKDPLLQEFGDASFLIDGSRPAVESDNNALNAFVQGSWENQKIIITATNSRKEISMKDFPREISTMRPLRFSPDDSSLFIFGSLILNDVSNPEGIYKYDPVDGKITELFYNESGGFQYLDPTGEEAYFIDRSTAPQKLIRVNLTTKTQKEILSPVHGGGVYFSKDGSRFINRDVDTLLFQFHSASDGKLIKALPISADFLGWSSNGEYIVYQQDHDQTTDHYYTELRAYNISTNKDTFLYKGRKPQDAGNDPKFSFLGFVPVTDNTQESIEKNGVSTSANSNKNPHEWKTYKNEKYGYQLDYPSWYANPSADSIDELVSFSGTDLYRYIFMEAKETALSSLDEWLKQNSDKKLVQRAQAGNQDTYITEYISPEGYSPNDRVTALIKNQKLFTLSTRIPETDLTRLLQSFRFNDK